MKSGSFDYLWRPPCLRRRGLVALSPPNDNAPEVADAAGVRYESEEMLF